MARPAAIVPVKLDEHYMNFLIYGEPGVGKSVLSATGERTLLLLNNNDESSAAASLGIGESAHKWVVPDYATMEEAYEYMLHEGCQYYKHVVIDNGTLLQEQAMYDEIMPQLVARHSTRSLWVPDQREYLINQNQLATYIRRFAALPVHFIITFHEMVGTDKDDRVVYLPLVQGGQGALAQKICGYMNIVGYMYKHAEKTPQGMTDHRRILFQRRGKFYAKSRWAGLPPGLQDNQISIPNMEALIRKRFPAFGQPPGQKARSTAKKTATPAQRRTA